MASEDQVVALVLQTSQSFVRPCGELVAWLLSTLVKKLAGAGAGAPGLLSKAGHTLLEHIRMNPDGTLDVRDLNRRTSGDVIVTPVPDVLADADIDLIGILKQYGIDIAAFQDPVTGSMTIACAAKDIETMKTGFFTALKRNFGYSDADALRVLNGEEPDLTGDTITRFKKTYHKTEDGAWSHSELDDEGGKINVKVAADGTNIVLTHTLLDGTEDTAEFAIDPDDGFEFAFIQADYHVAAHKDVANMKSQRERHGDHIGTPGQNRERSKRAVDNVGGGNGPTFTRRRGGVGEGRTSRVHVPDQPKATPRR